MICANAVGRQQRHRHFGVMVLIFALMASCSAQLDKCDYMFKLCWEQCGKPTYFPFTCNVDPNTVFNPVANQVIASCSGPLECAACMGLGTTCAKKTCSKCTDPNNPAIWKASLIPTTLTWCECCALNCNGFRADCVSGTYGFCTKSCPLNLMCRPQDAPAVVAANMTTTTAPANQPTPFPTPFPTPVPTPFPTPLPTAAPTPAPTPPPGAPAANDGTPAAVCAKLNADWYTDYAPGTGDDVNWNSPQTIQSGDSYAQCNPGTVKPLFMNDALTRLNFYRWLVGLQPATVSSTNQAKAQKCALMLARSQNSGSPNYVDSPDPHTVQTGFTCQDADAREAAQFSNIYNGQSFAGLNYLWQTTPAFVLSGFVTDTSSSKVGHRQNVLCPNLDAVSFGHICFNEPSSTRYLCGGCQWAYGRNANGLPAPLPGNPSGFVAWPPRGTVPSVLLPNSQFVYWSFATLELRAGLFDSFTVTVNGQPADTVQRLLALCTGSGMPGYSQSTQMVWIRFRPPGLSFNVGSPYNIVVRATGNGVEQWSYTTTPYDCANAPPPPPPTPVAPTPAPTPLAVVCGNGKVEGAEQCDNNDPCCDPFTCQYRAAGFECRPQAGVCDVAETCSGISSTCPANAVLPGGQLCRGVSGACDVAEYCNGVSTSCPNDLFLSVGAVCRAPAGDCDVAEACTGSSAQCPTNLFKAASVECRAASGVCDEAELCTGSSAFCPTDQVKVQWTLCRPVLPGALCDQFDFCDGVAKQCPPDSVRPAGSGCRAAVGACDIAEVCDGVSANCPNDARASAGTSCRAAAGTCDVAETCDGNSGQCPSDTLRSAGFSCRAAVGECDLAETCSGASSQCPGDAFKVIGTTCGAIVNASGCVAQPVCSGVGGACPAPQNKPASSVCDDGNVCTSPDRCTANGVCSGPASGLGGQCECQQNSDCVSASRPCATATCSMGKCSYQTVAAGAVCRPQVAGGCDVQEVCDGVSQTCPPDVVRNASTVCRAAAADCDVAEMCDGVSPLCPANLLRPNGALCRESRGACDVVEYCSGVSTTCPNDAFLPAQVCRPASGDCDVEERCSGSSAACPADTFANATTVCRTAAGPCDLPELCNGNSRVCPLDQYRNASFECRAANGACDAAEFCSGVGAQCSGDVVRPAGVSCRAAAGVCDIGETCDGQSKACPIDAFVAAGSECRGVGGACDVAETCTGSSAACPADAFKAGGMTCRAARAAAPGTTACDVAETCTGSSAQCPVDAFAAAGTVCRVPTNNATIRACDAVERCTGADPLCPVDELQPIGYVCDDGKPCTGPDACNGDGICTGPQICQTCMVDTDCDDGNPCSSDKCVLSMMTNTRSCQYGVAPAGVLCRAPAGPCDVADVCDGQSQACPNDLVAPLGTECRAAVDLCDVAEVCSGDAKACPSDRVAPINTVCRAAATTCDTEERCNGVAVACPIDNIAVNGTVCRAAVGLCDVAERCDGQTIVCPSDRRREQGAVCRPPIDLCDKAEQCDGANSDCPSDAFLTNGTVCRQSAGVCDAPETCSGQSSGCPANLVVTAGALCRAAVDLCDAVETCDGVNAQCPPDANATVGVVCRDAAGPCDLAETCSGTSRACPANAFRLADVVCRSAHDVCDVDEKCTGSSAQCPNDLFAVASRVCRASRGACDVEETCSGSAAACPPDVLVAANQTCRAAAMGAPCDLAERCDGASFACPLNELAPVGSACVRARPNSPSCSSAPAQIAGMCTDSGVCAAQLPVGCACTVPADCNDGNACTVDVCDAGTCRNDQAAPKGTVCRAAVAGGCDVAEQCDGVALACPADAVEASGVVCRQAAGNCDIAEVCGGVSGACPADVFRPAAFVCRAAESACDAAEVCSGSSANCPTNAPLAAGTVCRAAAGVCDRNETCDGVSFACPFDAQLPEAAPCNDHSQCTVDDKCVAGVCTGTRVCECEIDEDCVARNSACTKGTCVVGKCVATPLNVGAMCDDGDNCTTSDACSASGVCAGVNAACPLAPLSLVTQPIGGDGGGDDVAGSLGPDVVCGGRGQCCQSRCVCAPEWTGERCTQAVVPVVPTTPAPVTPAPTNETVDECPANPRKLLPGKCGCAVDDTDGDGIEDCEDRSVTLQRYDWAQQIPVFDSDVTNRLVALLGIPELAVSSEPFPEGDSVQVDVQSFAKPDGIAEAKLPAAARSITLYAYIFDIVVGGNGSVVPQPNADGVQELQRNASLCLRRQPPASATQYKFNRELCLGFWNSTARAWQCADADVTSRFDGLVCGRASHFSVWTLLPKDEADKPILDVVLRAFEDIGVPLGGAIAIGVIGFLLAIWVMFASIYLTRLAYLERKQRLPWHDGAEERARRRAEIEALNPAAADAVVEDKPTSVVLDQLAPQVQRDRRRNAKRSDAVRNLVAELASEKAGGEKNAIAAQLQRNLSFLDVDGDGTVDIPIALKNFEHLKGMHAAQHMASGKLVVDGNQTRRMGTKKLAAYKPRHMASQEFLFSPSAPDATGDAKRESSVEPRSNVMFEFEKNGGMATIGRRGAAGRVPNRADRRQTMATRLQTRAVLKQLKLGGALPGDAKRMMGGGARNRDDDSDDDDDDDDSNAAVDPAAKAAEEDALKRWYDEKKKPAVADDKKSRRVTPDAAPGLRRETSMAIPVPPKAAKSQRECAKCQSPLSGDVVAALNKHWHKSCFTCGVCRTVLAADFFEVDGRPTCAGCMKAQHPDFKCAGCGQILDGKYFRVGPEEAYHLACFVCSKCDDTIAGEFIKNGDKVLCVKCGSNMKKESSKKK